MSSPRRILHFQVSAKEAVELEAEAESLGVSLSELIRQRVNGTAIEQGEMILLPRKFYNDLLERIRQVEEKVKRLLSSSSPSQP